MLDSPTKWGNPKYTVTKTVSVIRAIFVYTNNDQNIHGGIKARDDALGGGPKNFTPRKVKKRRHKKNSQREGTN